VQHSPAVYHTIVAVDMADFTHPDRTDFHQAAMRKGLDEALETAFDTAGVGWAACDIEDRGDGKFILIPAAIPKSVIFEQLPGLMLQGLIRHNALHVAEARIQLRMAVHSGEVVTDASGRVGGAVNDTFRILDAERCKTDLRQSSGILAVVVSESIYDTVVRMDPAKEPAKYEQIDVKVKHMRANAWLRIFGTVEEQSRVLPMFPPAALRQLRDLLDDLVLPRLPALLAKATGPGVQPLGRDANAWEMVEFLLDLNAEPGGFPRLITFVELLAGQAEGTLAEKLRKWNDAQAAHLRLVDRLGQLRADLTGSAGTDQCLYLVIAIDHDLFDENRYVVSHWRQDDPAEWAPKHGEPRTATLAQLETVVDELVIDAENAWTGHKGEVALEFVLPRGLLNLPVHTWSRELRTPDPSPLVLHYPIVVRSLERMRATHWHRVWHAKWRVVAGDGGRVYIATTADADQPYRIAATLQDEGDPQVVSMVLSKAPSREVGPHDELSAALRAGLPGVLWMRQEGDSHALYEVVDHLGQDGTLVDLPRRVHRARRAVLGNPDQQMHSDVIRDLVILWDNPGRLVYLDQPGDTADERERAS
jgi:hypothetical protein